MPTASLRGIRPARLTSLSRNNKVNAQSSAIPRDLVSIGVDVGPGTFGKRDGTGPANLGVVREEMQTKKPNLQKRSGTTKTAPSGTIQTAKRGNRHTPVVLMILTVHASVRPSTFLPAGRPCRPAGFFSVATSTSPPMRPVAATTTTAGRGCAR